MHTTSVSGVAFSTELVGADLKQARYALGSAQKHANGRMAFSSMVANSPMATDFVRFLLEEDPKFVLASAFHAASRMPVAKRCSLERVITAGVQSPGVKNGAPVTVSARTKADGTLRPVCAFSIEHRTAQTAVKKVLSPFLMPKPFQFTELGVPKAVEAIQSAAASGYRYAAKLDIKQHFPSFNRDALIGYLPLPTKVVDHVVIGRHMTMKVKPGSYSNITVQQVAHGARQGILTGSVCSPVIASISTSKLEVSELGDVIVINVADDFLILAMTAASLEAAVMSLTGAVGSLPGGNFALVCKHDGHLSDSLDFLGHRLKWSDGLSVRVSDKNSAKFYAHLQSLEQQLHWEQDKAQKNTELVAKQLRYATGWSQAFKACSDSHDHYMTAIAAIQDSAKMLKTNLHALEKIGSAIGGKWHAETSGLD